MSILVEEKAFVARRYQAVASLSLLVLLVGTCLATDLLARDRGLERSLTAKSSEYAEKTRTIFSNTGNFIDFEERLMLDEIPNADYSRGGVYFFGSSNMKWAFTTWDLPAEQKRLIGNYGIGASSHTDQLRLIQYLIKERKFLTAGERNMVILGVSFTLGRTDPPTGYFASLLRRHGVYTITDDGQITPTQMSAVERWLRIEKARSTGFIWNLGRLAKGTVMTLAGYRRPAPRGMLSPDSLRGFMGAEWQQNMDVEVERLRETIFLLQSHHAQVKVILLPEPTWEDNLPFRTRYDPIVRALCQATATPFIDLSHSMPDEAFVDDGHMTVEAQEKFRALVMGEIIGHLQKLEKIDTSGLPSGQGILEPAGHERTAAGPARSASTAASTSPTIRY
jgi:hypothetical protein